MKKDNKKELYYEDCWMYILLLSTLVILLESIKIYTFTVFNTKITFAIFLLPLVYFIVNYITKKYDYKKAIAAISISGVSFVLFSIIMSFALEEQFIMASIAGEFCGYVVSQFVSLTIYEFLLNNTKMPILLIFLNYLFALIVYYLFYTMIHLNMIILDDFWIGYFVTLFIQFFVCIPIAIIDKRIKRGREKLKVK